MSDLLTHGLGVMNDADTALKQVSGKLGTALDALRLFRRSQLLLELEKDCRVLSNVANDQFFFGELKICKTCSTKKKD